jgi:hypothetical protein
MAVVGPPGLFRGGVLGDTGAKSVDFHFFWEINNNFIKFLLILISIVDGTPSGSTTEDGGVECPGGTASTVVAVLCSWRWRASVRLPSIYYSDGYYYYYHYRSTHTTTLT